MKFYRIKRRSTGNYMSSNKGTIWVKKAWVSKKLETLIEKFGDDFDVLIFKADPIVITSKEFINNIKS